MSSDFSEMGRVGRIFWSYVFPTPFAVAGLIVLTLGCRSLWRADSSKGWPTAEGVIVSSVVGTDYSSDGTTYRPEVRFTYAVDGKEYRGNRVQFGGDVWTSWRSSADDVVGRYPEGRRVEVAYAAKDPSESVLEPGIAAKTWLLPGIGFVFMAAGFGMLVGFPLAFRRADKKARAGLTS